MKPKRAKLKGTDVDDNMARVEVFSLCATSESTGTKMKRAKMKRAEIEGADIDDHVDDSD